VFANPRLQEFFIEVYQNLPEWVILEAEIHADSLSCREIAGICNSKDKEIPDDMKLYFFGYYHEELSFYQRILALTIATQEFMSGDKFQVVRQYSIESPERAQQFFEDALSKGFEGAVLMDGRKYYKQGRVTIKEGIGYKMKPFKEEDLPIIGVTERLENLNESQTNELGQSFKRNTVDAKKETGIAAAFICDMGDGVTTKVTLTGTEEERRNIWENREKYIGMIAVVKSMDYGAKEKLRHPVLVRVKEKCET
jgi:ATP-dependent DNA ligase